MKKICVFIMMSLLVCSAAGCGREKTSAETGRQEVTETGAELLQEKTDSKTDGAGAKGEADSEADETGASDEAGASGREDIKVYGCDLLTQKKAERIGDEIYDIIHGARGAYQFENERIVFTQQRESDGMVTVQAAYYGEEREEPFADSMEPDTEALKQMGREMLQNGLEAHGVSFCRQYLGIE